MRSRGEMGPCLRPSSDRQGCSTLSRVKIEDGGLWRRE